MDANLRQLRAFSRVARERSFTRAAAALHLSQPALTVQIRALEAALGVKLFDRNTRAVRLTPMGGSILPAVERLLRDLEALADDARELGAGNRGVVHVAALPSIASSLLPRAIARLAQRHPGIVVRLRDAIAQRVVALVQSDEVDVGIGVSAGASTELTFRSLLSDRLEAVMPPRHRLARSRSVSLAELAREPLVMMDAQTSVRALLEREMAAAGVPSRPAYEVTYMSTAIGLAKAGLGIALLPTSALEMQALHALERRPIRGAPLAREIGIMARSARTLSPAAEAFLETLAETARDFNRRRTRSGSARTAAASRSTRRAP
jgi:DNA-binding transcriptional LysR family regulator